MRWLFAKAAIEIRHTCTADALFMAALHKQGFERAWSLAEFESLLSDQSVISHVAQKQGLYAQSILGFILSRIAADEAEILSIVVATNARGKGVAGQLLAHHLSALAQAGILSLFLEVDELNKTAIALYKRFGFEAVGTRKSYYKKADGSTPSAIIMKRSLQ